MYCVRMGVCVYCVKVGYCGCVYYVRVCTCSPEASSCRHVRQKTCGERKEKKVSGCGQCMALTVWVCHQSLSQHTKPSYTVSPV